MFVTKYQLVCEFCGKIKTFKNMEEAYKPNDWVHTRRDLGDDAGTHDICPECWDIMRFAAYSTPE